MKKNKLEAISIILTVILLMGFGGFLVDKLITDCVFNRGLIRIILDSIMLFISLIMIVGSFCMIGDLLEKSLDYEFNEEESK